MGLIKRGTLSTFNWAGGSYDFLAWVTIFATIKPMFTSLGYVFNKTIVLDTPSSVQYRKIIHVFYKDSKVLVVEAYADLTGVKTPLGYYAGYFNNYSNIYVYFPNMTKEAITQGYIESLGNNFSFANGFRLLRNTLGTSGTYLINFYLESNSADDVFYCSEGHFYKALTTTTGLNYDNNLDNIIECDSISRTPNNYSCFINVQTSTRVLNSTDQIFLPVYLGSLTSKRVSVMYEIPNTLALLIGSIMNDGVNDYMLFKVNFSANAYICKITL